MMRPSIIARLPLPPLLLLLLLLLRPRRCSPQNAAVEALVAQRNEGFQQAQPLDASQDGTAEPVLVAHW